MTKRWLRRAKSHQRTVGLLLNGGGAVATTAVLAVIVMTKFLAGAWIVIALVPFVILLLREVHDHYQDVVQQLALTPTEILVRFRMRKREVCAIVPVGSLNIASTQVLEYAMAICNDVTAVHVADDAIEAE